MRFSSPISFTSRKINVPQSNSEVNSPERKYADWMIAALDRDSVDLRNCIFIYDKNIEFKHLIDPDSYFEVVYDIRSSSVFTLDIGGKVEGHIFYENSEMERIPEIRDPIRQLDRYGHGRLILRQWVSESMMNKVALDGGEEITLHFREVNILVEAKYPDGSTGPQCILPIPSKISKILPTQIEIEGQ